MPALKRRTPGPAAVAGAFDDPVNVDPESDAVESSECGNCGSHVVSGWSESLETSVVYPVLRWFASSSISSHRSLRTTANDIGRVHARRYEKARRVKDSNSFATGLFAPEWWFRFSPKLTTSTKYFNTKHADS